GKAGKPSALHYTLVPVERPTLDLFPPSSSSSSSSSLPAFSASSSPSPSSSFLLTTREQVLLLRTLHRELAKAGEGLRKGKDGVMARLDLLGRELMWYNDAAFALSMPGGARPLHRHLVLLLDAPVVALREGAGVEWVLSELERLVSASRAWTRNIVSLMGVEEGEEDEEEEEREEPGEEGGKRRAKRKARRKALVVMKEMLEEGIVKAVEMEEEAQARGVVAHAARYRATALSLFGASSPSPLLDVCSLPPPSLFAAAVLRSQQEAYTAHREAPFPLSLLPESVVLAWMHAVYAWCYRALETLEGGKGASSPVLQQTLHLHALITRRVQEARTWIRTVKAWDANPDISLPPALLPSLMRHLDAAGVRLRRDKLEGLVRREGRKGLGVRGREAAGAEGDEEEAKKKGGMEKKRMKVEGGGGGGWGGKGRKDSCPRPG
ncbi:transcription elongation factor s-central domain partial, partial [Nannochloropsis oceanica]